MKFMKNFCSDATQVKQWDLWIFSDPVGSDVVLCWNPTSSVKHRSGPIQFMSESLFPDSGPEQRKRYDRIRPIPIYR
jgi:hypothetical protein